MGKGTCQLGKEHFVQFKHLKLLFSFEFEEMQVDFSRCRYIIRLASVPIIWKRICFQFGEMFIDLQSMLGPIEEEQNYAWSQFE